MTTRGFGAAGVEFGRKNRAAYLRLGELPKTAAGAKQFPRLHHQRDLRAIDLSPDPRPGQPCRSWWAWRGQVIPGRA